MEDTRADENHELAAVVAEGFAGETRNKRQFAMVSKRVVS